MPQGCGRSFTEELITGYLDRVIDPEECRQVRRHLRHCAACSRLLDDLCLIRATMKMKGVGWQVGPRAGWQVGPRARRASSVTALPWMA